MALSMRLSRGGSKKRPYYKIVVADARAPRDGKFIERIGSYNPQLPKDSAERIVLDGERAKHWLAAGAQPSDRVSRFLDAAGVKERKARNNPNKAEPGQKAKDRAEDRATKAAEAEEAAAAAAAAPAPEPETVEEATSEEVLSGEAPVEGVSAEAPAEGAVEPAAEEPQVESASAPAEGADDADSVEAVAEGAPASVEAIVEEAPVAEEAASEESAGDAAASEATEEKAEG